MRLQQWLVRAANLLWLRGMCRSSKIAKGPLELVARGMHLRGRSSQPVEQPSHLLLPVLGAHRDQDIREGS